MLLSTFYHLRLVSERLSEAGMKIKPDDGKHLVAWHIHQNLRIQNIAWKEV